MGVIPPKKTMYASTIYQIKVDPEIAPDGITVYGFTPHMHALGKKIWVEKLTRNSEHKKDILESFDYLEKVRLARFEQDGITCFLYLRLGGNYLLVYLQHILLQ